MNPFEVNDVALGKVLIANDIDRENYKFQKGYIDAPDDINDLKFENERTYRRKIKGINRDIRNTASHVYDKMKWGYFHKCKNWSFKANLRAGKFKKKLKNFDNLTWTNKEV
ncbi:MAG: hypothetical protein K2M23_01730 [Alphaproteobacteria bacterium]|nr:hypothetical protein [Alphaproteobacteria bacterium]